MELTEEQIKALDEGQVVRFTDERGTPLIVLRADVYDRIKTVLYDDTSWTSEEKQAILKELGKKAGWNDPELDVYEKYRENS